MPGNERTFPGRGTGAGGPDRPRPHQEMRRCVDNVARGTYGFPVEGVPQCLVRLSACDAARHLTIRAGASNLALAVASAVAFLATGCSADYPSCETDKDCHAKEFCVANKCQQCRDSNDCPAGQRARRASATRSPATAAARPTAPPTRSASPTSCKACAHDKECPGGQQCVKGTCTRRSPARPTTTARRTKTASMTASAARRRRRRPRPGAVHAGRGVLRLQRVGADDRGDRGARARRRVPEEGRPPARPIGHTDSARHAGVQPGAVREARPVGARPPGPAGRRRDQLSMLAARSAGRQGTDEPSWARIAVSTSPGSSLHPCADRRVRAPGSRSAAPRAGSC